MRSRARTLTTCFAVASLVALGALEVGGVLPGLPGGAHSSVEAATKTPGNLLTGNQASFTTSTGGWVGVGAALSWVPTAGDSLPGALGVTATSSSAMAAESGTPSAGGLVAATAGYVYAASASAEALTRDEDVEPVLVFYDSSGTQLNEVFGPRARAVTGSWTQATEVSAVAPSTAVSVALVFYVPSAASGDEIYLDDAWVQGVPDQIPPVAGPLHTSGNQILDANGHAVRFRGVVLDGLEVDPTLIDSPVSQRAILEAKAWGANFVRVPLGEQFWVSTNCDYVPSYESTVDQVVNWITSLGMVALLDLHTNTVGGCEPGSQHDSADEAQSPMFWSQVAGRYGNPSSPEYSPLVAFDLYNEPHDISDSTWLDGGTTTDVYGPMQTYQAAGMQQLYNSVRSAGSQNLVFISGDNWANTPPSTLVSGFNIVYAAHTYTCPSSPPPSEGGTCTNSSPYDPSQILDNWLKVSSSLPVVITEFGWPSQEDGTYISNVITFAEDHGWGWVAFAWQDETYPPIWDLTLAFLSDATAEPSPSGMPVLCALAVAASGYSPCTAPPPTVASIPLPTPTATTSPPPATTSSALAYDGLVPTRICDTRPTSDGSPANQCTGQSLPGGSSRTVDMPSQVPSDAGAVVLNVTVVAGRGSQGYLTVYPTGQIQPTTANVTFTEGQVVGNLVTVGVGQDLDRSDAPSVTLFNGTSGGGATTIDVVVDLEGYYAPGSGSPAGEYHALEPSRIADTRCASGCAGESVPAANSSLSTVGPAGSIEVKVAGVGAVPQSGVQAVVANIAVTDATAPSYATIWPTGSSRPLSANVNWALGETLSAKVVMEVGQSGDISVFNDAGDADFVVDVEGYFSSSSGSQGSLFTPLAPERVVGTSSGPAEVNGGSSTTAEIAGAGAIPSYASGAVLDVADVAPPTGNYLTVYPSGTSPPTTADVNFVPADSFNVVTNASYATLGQSGSLSVYNGPSSAGTAGVAADLFGYFTPAS